MEREVESVCKSAVVNFNGCVTLKISHWECNLFWSSFRWYRRGIFIRWSLRGNNHGCTMSLEWKKFPQFANIFEITFGSTIITKYLLPDKNVLIRWIETLDFSFRLSKSGSIRETEYRIIRFEVTLAYRSVVQITLVNFSENCLN